MITVIGTRLRTPWGSAKIMSGEQKNCEGGWGSFSTCRDLRNAPGLDAQGGLPLLGSSRTAVHLELRAAVLALGLGLGHAVRAGAHDALAAQQIHPMQPIAEDRDLQSATSDVGRDRLSGNATEACHTDIA